MHDFGLLEAALKMKLKYIPVFIGIVWETGSVFNLNVAIMHFVDMGTSFAVVLV